MSKGLWGSDTTDERKPTWPWVSEYIGYANCFATSGGWTIRWPWGDEVIVALSNLTTKLGIANIAQSFMTVTGTYLTNSNAQGLSFKLSFNEAVHVTGAPTLQLISVVGAANGGVPANVELVYNAVASNLTQGTVVFDNAAISLGAIGYGGDDLVINSSSILVAFDTIHDAAGSANVANTIPVAAYSTVHVYLTKPVHTATVRVPAAVDSVKDTTGQQLGFSLDFNDVVVVTGVPFVIAIGPNTGIANTKLSYNAAASNVALGNLVFQSTLQDYSALTGNCLFTLATDGTSTNSSDLWAGIVGAPPIGVVVAHGVIVGNTINVIQHEPFQIAGGALAGANVVALAAQPLVFSVQLDRAAIVNTTIATPTIKALSDGAGANTVLTYASGNGTTTLVFSNTADFSGIVANQTYIINSTSVITGFNAISNGGIAFSAANVTMTANHVHVLITTPILKSTANVLATGATVTNGANQVVEFSIAFDRAVHVNTALAFPTVRAISNNQAFTANLALTYASGEGTDTLVFSNTSSLVATQNANYFVNATSIITGFNAIANTGMASQLVTTLTGATSNNIALVTA